jgi:hypothetical protein
VVFFARLQQKDRITMRMRELEREGEASTAAAAAAAAAAANAVSADADLAAAVPNVRVVVVPRKLREAQMAIAEEKLDVLLYMAIGYCTNRMCTRITAPCGQMCCRA